MLLFAAAMPAAACLRHAAADAPPIDVAIYTLPALDMIFAAASTTAIMFVIFRYISSRAMLLLIYYLYTPSTYER